MIEETEVVVGTYEEFLIGYKAKLKNDKYTLLSTFSTKSHTASVRSVVASGKYLASGGADDKIFVFDMHQRKEIQILMNHDGTVNTLTFTPDSKHLLSGGDDGRMFKTRVGSWKIDGNWEKAHNGSAVKYITCHPSGKLALSLGQDLVVRTWNLITGRCVFKTNLKSKEHLGNSPECIEWSPNGEYFLLSGLRVVELISIENKKTTKEIKVKTKPACICWISDDIFATGLEDGNIILSTIHLSDGDVTVKVDEKRIKCMAYSNKILATASSSGELSIWDVSLINRSLKKITSTNIGCRPTCIALINLAQFRNDYLLTESKLTDVTTKIRKSTNPNSNFKNLQRVSVEYEDSSKGKPENSNEESENDDNVGTFVRLKKKENKNDPDNYNQINKKVKTLNKNSSKKFGNGKIIKHKNNKKFKKNLLKNQIK